MSHKKDFLFCVDSDGCVIDGMKVKHVECFGPSLAEEWNLGSKSEEIMEYWNRLNLYSMNRGPNRFIGLLMALEHIKQMGYLNLDIKTLKEWVESTKELSAENLKKTIEENDNEILKKSLSWSDRVDAKLSSLSELKKQPFWGVAGILQNISGFADIAVVSSENVKAVENEWEENGLLRYVKYIMTREKGTKKECILNLLDIGYEKDKTIMVGDAPGDMQSAKDAGVLYYPIIPEKEIGSWSRLERTVFGKFLKGNFTEELVNKYENEFIESLNN